ncbi:unnamed protein product [Meloidogyne enterolobii]|uniref:Uncharacterized protein n=2 Tax=Meloidogyne enterolobii TaxID=390850 RepID=A0A6V7XUG3_MELEN|nr:unnamed protein product [Meloidogyne enterolobii]
MIVNTNNKKAMFIVTLSIVVLLLLVEHVNSKEMSINVDLKDEVSKDKTPQKEEEKLENKAPAPVDHNYQAETVKTEDKGSNALLAVAVGDLIISLLCSCCCCVLLAVLLYFLLFKRKQPPPPPPPPYRE